MEPENLPRFLGGTCECEGGCLAKMPGPWDAEVPAGPVMSSEEHKDEDDPADLADLRSAIQGSMNLSSEKPPVGRFGDNAITPMNTQTEDDSEFH